MRMGTGFMRTLLRLLLFLGVACPRPAHGQAYYYPNGSTVADFTVVDIDGQTHQLYNYTAQGKYVLMDFFTLWCEPCQNTATYFAEFYQTYGCNGGDVICISLDYDTNTAADIEAYSDAYCGPWAHPPVVSGALALTDIFGVGTAPNYCLIGPDNTMINNFIWTVTSMGDLAAAFPANSVAPLACGVGVDEGTMRSAAFYPNPTTGPLSTQAQSSGAARIHVCDVHGVLLRSLMWQRTVDISALPSGFYTISLIGASGEVLGHQRILLLPDR